jgi:DNA ligase-1
MFFGEVAGYFDRLEKASSRIEMTKILSEMLGKAAKKEIGGLVYLCQGRVAPEYKGIETGMGEKFVEAAISKVSGHEVGAIEKEYKKLGDLGLVAEELLKRKRQQSLFREKLDLSKVYDNLLKIAGLAGARSQKFKIRLLAELLNSAKPIEARYITRFPLGNLRLGIGDPTIMDALAQIYCKDYLEDKEMAKLIGTAKKKDSELYERKVRQVLRERIEAKYNIHPDLGEIAGILMESGIDGLEGIKTEHSVPIRPSLAERLPSSSDVLKKIGRCAVEAKYDGLRLQLHKKGNDVAIFSRRLENMTDMFPEIVKALREDIREKQVILEGEALAFNEQTSEFYPFQITMQRKRKYGVDKMAKEFPLRLFVFDVLVVNGKSMIDAPFSERRKRLEKMLAKGKVITPTELIISGSEEEIDRFFADAVGRGLEGIMAKDLKAPYTAGARKFAWIKLKRSYRGELSDSVDVVIIGYFRGKGGRARFGLGALLTAVYDSRADRFASIAKIGTGFSEEQLAALEKRLSKIRVKGRPANVISLISPDVWVNPKYVIEVVADEITKSPVHTAGKKGKEPGLALRFPRMVSFRDDKKAEDATTVKEIEKMYTNQKYVSLEAGKGTK